MTIIENIIQQLNNNYDIQQTEVRYIAKTGSSLFLNEYNDLDYVVITNWEEAKYFSFNFTASTGAPIDVFVFDYGTFKQTISLENWTRLSKFMLGFILKDTSLEYGTWDEEFNFLKNKEKYIDLVKENIPVFVYDNGFYYEKDGGVFCTMPKTSFWYIVPLMMIQNNSTELTAPMVSVIEQSVNFNLDDSWKSWIREKLNKEALNIPLEEKTTEVVNQSLIAKKEFEIEQLKNALGESDYKIIKCYEAQLQNQEMPYDITTLTSERDTIRNNINQLEREINNLLLEIS